jgi:hypothetical protein
MKPSEILRNLADMIDARQQSERPIGAPGALSPRIMPKEPEVEMVDDCGCDDELAQQPDDIMIPPLQLKIELLKKATGVESVYDDEECDEEDPKSHSYDELELIKKNAGLNPVVLDALGDDEPLDV